MQFFPSRLICREWKQESEAVGIYAGTDVMCRRRKEVERVLRLHWCFWVKARVVTVKQQGKGGGFRVREDGIELRKLQSMRRDWRRPHGGLAGGLERGSPRGASQCLAEGREVMTVFCWKKETEEQGQGRR